MPLLFVLLHWVALLNLSISCSFIFFAVDVAHTVRYLIIPLARGELSKREKFCTSTIDRS